MAGDVALLHERRSGRDLIDDLTDSVIDHSILLRHVAGRLLQVVNGFHPAVQIISLVSYLRFLAPGRALHGRYWATSGTLCSSGRT
ncbi:hypothetical protein Vau01_105770 [Virgisporangium aurantiacum]|uniref:Uncharacterized protein n=1 Tax=Virgisporangium aurantiacum TaxID=175570 RepID=A0A8J3ZFR7_9ACTN|nr:hypothetical protein Vau01_105770 [Virgisporangium aurantiacum]